MTQTKILPDNLMIEHRIPVVYTAQGYAKIKLPISASAEDIEEALEDYPLEEMEDVEFQNTVWDWSEVWKPQISEHVDALQTIGEVFQQLDAQNILPVASECCNGDSCAAAEERMESESRYEGFVYLHHQGIENLFEDGNCAIGFGSRNDVDAEHIEVGKKLAAALEEAGFTISWDGTADRKVEIKGY